ncbi:MAG: ATP-binding cassette domain-containing protein [Candidatus Sulfopaludibacter sp.]|nr:ATP-binding cassette domain-containing protein [Candidatus Sulfopaludibacter sp.]
MPTTPLLNVCGLSITVAERSLVSAATFAIPAGSIVGLSGDSGCGKTTLALALLRLLPRRYGVTGSIRLRERELMALPESRLERIRGAELSMVFQDPLAALNPVMRVRDQVSEAVRAHAGRQPVEQLLELVELPYSEHIRQAYPHQLSGGERQRVCLALALAAEPALVIADEPFSALDACRVLELARLFRSLKLQLRTSFLLISHSRDVLARLADGVIAMRDGCMHGS